MCCSYLFFPFIGIIHPEMKSLNFFTQMSFHTFMTFICQTQKGDVRQEIHSVLSHRTNEWWPGAVRLQIWPKKWGLCNISYETFTLLLSEKSNIFTSQILLKCTYLNVCVFKFVCCEHLCDMWEPVTIYGTIDIKSYMPYLNMCKYEWNLRHNNSICL